MIRALRAPLLAGLLALSLGSCGGGGGGNGGGGKLSSAALATRESALCEKAATVWDSQNTGAITTYAQAIQLLDKTSAAFDSLLSQLRKLQPPDELKARWAAFIAAQARRDAAFDAARGRARTDPVGATNALVNLANQVGGNAPAAAAASAMGPDFICI
jgi:hypothetical protein